MKIQESNPVESQEQYNRVKDINKNRDTGQKENTNKADDSMDRVTISEKAKEKNLKDQQSEIRSDTVEAVKKAVDSGGYDLDSMKVAKKVLDEM